MVHAHSGLRWVVLVLLLLAIIKGFRGFSGNKKFTPGTKKLFMFAMVSCHIQLVLGLILYFTSDAVDLDNLFANDITRFYGLEHIVGMILAIVIITIGYSTSKRASTDKKKYRRVAICYTIGLLLILGSIPWPFMQKFQNLGLGWF